MICYIGEYWSTTVSCIQGVSHLKNVLVKNKELLLTLWMNLTVSQTGLASPYCAPPERVHANMLQHPMGTT